MSISSSTSFDSPQITERIYKKSFEIQIKDASQLNYLLPSDGTWIIPSNHFSYSAFSYDVFSDYQRMGEIAIDKEAAIEMGMRCKFLIRKIMENISQAQFQENNNILFFSVKKIGPADEHAFEKHLKNITNLTPIIFKNLRRDNEKVKRREKLTTQEIIIKSTNLQSAFIQNKAELRALCLYHTDLEYIHINCLSLKESLLSYLPSLEIKCLRLSNGNNLTDGLFLILSKMEKLEVLEIKGGSFTGNSFHSLSSLPNLEEIHLENIKIDEVFLDQILNLPLKALSLVNCQLECPDDFFIKFALQQQFEYLHIQKKINPRIIQELEKLMPNCEIHFTS
ncbi:MAG: hypothetical protein Tsb0015_13220 [Simkaniaceae bacterium]